ncbi:hypothetical protein ACSVDA_11955 [Cytobacillus sp. Hm23]
MRTSVNYMLRTNDPFTSSVLFPINYRQIPAIVQNYHLKYAPISQYPALMLLDYFLAKPEKELNPLTKELLISAVKEQTANFEEGLVIVEKGEREGIEGKDLLTVERDNVKDMSVLDSFYSFWRNRTKNMSLSKNSLFIKDLSRRGLIKYSSLPFLRDHISHLGISFSSNWTRDNEKRMEQSILWAGLKDYTHAMEIHKALGSYRENVTETYVRDFLANSLRVNKNGLSVSQQKSFFRDCVEGMSLGYGIKGDRDKVFELSLGEHYTGPRPYENLAQVEWEHSKSLRVFEQDRYVEGGIFSDRDIKSPLSMSKHTLSQREVKDDFYVSSGGFYERQLTKDLIIEYLLEDGRLLARQWPSLIHHTLVGSRDNSKGLNRLSTKNLERLIQGGLTIGLLQHYERYFIGDLSIQQHGGYQRDVVDNVYIHQLMVRSIRDSATELNVPYSLLSSDRDTGNYMSVFHPYILSNRIDVGSLSNFYQLRPFVRNNVSNMYVPYSLGGYNRDTIGSLYVPGIHKSSSRIIGDNLLNLIEETLRFKRDISNDLFLPGDSIQSSRDSEKSINLEGNIYAERDFSNSTSIFNIDSYERDNVSGLYVSTQKESRKGKKKLSIEKSSPVKKAKNKLMTLHQSTEYEREVIKDTLIDFIGSYLRNKVKEMIGNRHPNEITNGAELLYPLLRAVLMDDEIFGELVTGLADVIDSVEVGERPPELKGSLLDENIYSAKEKIEYFLDKGLLQGTTINNSKGVVTFNINTFTRASENNASIISEEEDDPSFGYINADPSEFLPVEEVAKLNKQRPGYVNSSIYDADKSRRSSVNSNVEDILGFNSRKSGVHVETFLTASVSSKTGSVEINVYSGSDSEKESTVFTSFNSGKADSTRGYIDFSGGLEGNNRSILSTVMTSMDKAYRPDNNDALFLTDLDAGKPLTERYGIVDSPTEETGEKLKWVSILTNLLFTAEESTALGYVEYLQQSGVIQERHYSLLNGLVGDIVERKGAVFGDNDVTGGFEERKSTLVDSLEHGKGLLYKYDDYPLLQQGMEIEDWEIDLGFGVPEKYDPYDPYNSFYPWTSDFYSSLELAQLEDWTSFGGADWSFDKRQAQFRINDNHETPNGYILDNYDSTDYVFSIDFQVDPEESDDEGIGVVFKYVDDKNHYKFVIAGGPNNTMNMGSNYMQLFKVENGIERPLGTALAPHKWEKDEWYNIRVSYIDKQIKIWVNERLQYDMYDH